MRHTRVQKFTLVPHRDLPIQYYTRIPILNRELDADITLAALNKGLKPYAEIHTYPIVRVSSRLLVNSLIYILQTFIYKSTHTHVDNDKLKTTRMREY